MGASGKHVVLPVTSLKFNLTALTCSAGSVSDKGYRIAICDTFLSECYAMSFSYRSHCDAIRHRHPSADMSFTAGCIQRPRISGVWRLKSALQQWGADGTTTDGATASAGLTVGGGCH